MKYIYNAPISMTLILIAICMVIHSISTSGHHVFLDAYEENPDAIVLGIILILLIAFRILSAFAIVSLIVSLPAKFYYHAYPGEKVLRMIGWGAHKEEISKVNQMGLVNWWKQLPRQTKINFGVQASNSEYLLTDFRDTTPLDESRILAEPPVPDEGLVPYTTFKAALTQGKNVEFFTRKLVRKCFQKFPTGAK